MSHTIEISIDDAEPIGGFEDFWVSYWPPGKGSTWTILEHGGHERVETTVVSDSVLPLLSGLSLIKQASDDKGKKLWVAAFQEADLGQMVHYSNFPQTHKVFDLHRDGSTDGWRMVANSKQGIRLLAAWHMGGMMVAGKDSIWFTTPQLDGAKVWRIKLPEELREKPTVNPESNPEVYG